MVRHSREPDAQPDDRIASLVNEYFDRREAGESLTPASFAAEHPQLANELQPYLEGLALLDQIRSTTGGGSVPATAVQSPELPQIDGYELLEEIGRGGMGVVYKALQVATKRVVAMKVMLAGPFASPSVQKRFEREVELAARLNHPSIVTVLESGQVSSGQKYFAMSYVDGVHLDTYTSREKPGTRTALRLALLICDAIHSAHSVGVIHRDLKPANVLIDQEGHPHILDFGLAKATDQPESEDSADGQPSVPGQVLGTLRYLSPEQAAGATDEIDVRTDVYALGVMLYETLTGTLPFDPSGRPQEVIRRIREAPPRPPSSVSSGIDGEVQTILLKALEKEPALRYSSVQEMAEDVRRYLRGDPILAKRASRLYILRKKIQKHRKRIAVAAASLAVGLVGVWGGSLWNQHRQEQKRQIEWVEGRRAILRIQQTLEEGPEDSQVAAAYVALGRYPTIPEAPLVVAQAYFEAGKNLLREAEANEGEADEEDTGTDGEKDLLVAPEASELDLDPYEPAIQFLENQLLRDPSQWACLALLAELYAARDEDDEFALETDLESAAGCRALAGRGAESSAEGYYLRSFTTLDLSDALAYTLEATAKDPSRALAWERATYLADRLGDYELALQCTERLVALQPDATEWVTLRDYRALQASRLAGDVGEDEVSPVPGPPTMAATSQDGATASELATSQPAASLPD